MRMHKCIYVYGLKAGGSPELRGTLSLDAIPERSFLYTDGGGVGGVGGGCNNVMWSALDDVESWKMLLGWKMLLRCKFRCCLQKGGWGWWGGCNNVMWSALGDVESWKMLLGWKMLLRCKCRCCVQMKKVRSSFRPWFSSALSHVLLLNRTTKIKETALQMVSMFRTSLVIHGRCKNFLFQHGQTTSSSAMKMEVRLIKPFQRKT